MVLWKHLGLALGLILSKTSLVISDGIDSNTRSQNDIDSVNVEYACFLDVQKLSHAFQDGFYSCDVEWNVKVSFDISFQLGEYCSYDTTVDVQPPPQCSVEYNKLDCYVKFWDKCHMAGGRTITQDVHYDCMDDGLQFGLTLYGKVDCVPDSCITKTTLSQIAPAFATISHCTILSTSNIEVDKMDHDLKHNHDNNSDMFGHIDNSYDDENFKMHDEGATSTIEYTEGGEKVDVYDTGGDEISRMNRLSRVAIAAAVCIIAITVFGISTRFATKIFQSNDTTEETAKTTQAAAPSSTYGSIDL